MDSASSEPNPALRPSQSTPVVRHVSTNTRHQTSQSSSHSNTLTLEAVLSAAHGNPTVALETLLADRNNLYQQNVQLWKLMEKSRAGYANSLKDLDRIRAERDRALAKLDALGAHDQVNPSKSVKQIVQLHT
jgi:RalA-binding protein 1